MAFEPNSLTKLKLILLKSTYTKTLILKPGHLYMHITLSGSRKLDNYEIYMYEQSIFFDPGLDTGNIRASVSLPQKINWDELK